MRILGLDPGSLHTGYAVIEKRGSALKALCLGRLSPPRGSELAKRLAFLANGVEELIRDYQPTVAALETPFHGINPRSLIVLAQARGALLGCLGGHEIEILEHTPTQVKSAVTGSGRASKDQVARMVRLLLALGDKSFAADATDALAVALCCAQRYKLDGLARRLQKSP